MKKSQVMTREEAWKIMYPKPCKENSSPFELKCQKDSSEKKEFLDEVAKNHSTCGCEEGSHCSGNIEYEDAEQWAECVDGSNRSVCDTFPNGIQHHYSLNYGYVSSWCGCRVIFPYIKECLRGKIVGKVQHPFLETCDGKIFVCPPCTLTST